MSDNHRMDCSLAEPPADFSPPLQALWWLKKGELRLGPEWEKAHTICQSAEGTPDYDWVHALCHLVEDDHGNARYWFHRAGRPVSDDKAAVWQSISDALQAADS